MRLRNCPQKSIACWSQVTTFILSEYGFETNTCFSTESTKQAKTPRPNIQASPIRKIRHLDLASDLLANDLEVERLRASQISNRLGRLPLSNWGC